MAAPRRIVSRAGKKVVSVARTAYRHAQEKKFNLENRVRIRKYMWDMRKAQKRADKQVDALTDRISHLSTLLQHSAPNAGRIRAEIRLLKKTLLHFENESMQWQKNIDVSRQNLRKLWPLKKQLKSLTAERNDIILAIGHHKTFVNPRIMSLRQLGTQELGRRHVQLAQEIAEINAALNARKKPKK